MGCGCKRNKESKEKTSQLKKNSKLFSQYKERLEQCRSCEFATKSKNNGKMGLTIKSICTKSGRLLHNSLKEDKYSCPIGKF